jgi:hypothetical protein
MAKCTSATEPRWDCPVKPSHPARGGIPGASVDLVGDALALPRLTVAGLDVHVSDYSEPQPSTYMSSQADRSQAERSGPLEATPKPFTVFGWTEQQALEGSGVPHNQALTDSAFSGAHNHGDLANRWSHGAIVKEVSAELQRAGANRFVAQAAGDLVFVFKEAFVDQNFDTSDVVLLSDFELWGTGERGRNRASLEATVFADGFFVFNAKKEF